jgi:SAM-dependent methyltransferase
MDVSGMVHCTEEKGPMDRHETKTMSELSQYNPTSRFTGLADMYARCRPSYPPAAVDYIMANCGLDQNSVLVDIGSGTGISARLFAHRGVAVIGIEPNADMRARAKAEAFPPSMRAPVYQDGRAEATHLSDGMADAVLAAQAFHWCEPEAALREFHRILRPDGWVILLWNERDESDPFTAAYGAVVRSTPDAAAVEVPRGKAGEPLLTSPHFQGARRVVFHYQQELDEEGLLGRAFSASYAPREPSAAQAFADRLRDVFGQFEQAGKVVLCYETAVYLGRRSETRGQGFRN